MEIVKQRIRPRIWCRRVEALALSSLKMTPMHLPSSSTTGKQDYVAKRASTTSTGRDITSPSLAVGLICRHTNPISLQPFTT
jgi:hypothetical protein